jgi:hypothetical protein
VAPRGDAARVLAGTGVVAPRLGAARVRAAAERVPGGRKGVRMLAWSLEGGHGPVFWGGCGPFISEA